MRDIENIIDTKNIIDTENIEDIFDNINKKIKKTLEKLEKKCIKLESKIKKNNELLINEVRDLLVQYKVTYKTVSLV